MQIPPPQSLQSLLLKNIKIKLQRTVILPGVLYGLEILTVSWADHLIPGLIFL